MGGDLFCYKWFVLRVIVDLSNQPKTLLGYHSFSDKVESFLVLMGTFGKVDEFDASKEEWARMTQNFLANNTDSAAKKELYSCVLLVK